MKTSACAAISAKAAGSAPVIQTCAPSRAERVVQRRAAAGIEMGDHLVEQQHRRKSGHLRQQAGMREHEPDQQAFCSPVEASAAGMPFGA